MLDDPKHVREMRSWAGKGETIRVTPSVPFRLVVFGDQAAMIAASGDRFEDREIVVRIPAIVIALRELFDRIWRRGVSLPLESTPDESTERRRLLELLALGVKDETAARHLGVSIRTVRRRIAELLEELGATTRFQAGMEAARRDWI
jgi:DNA-binding NarL/FixJ family response regulator